MASAVLGAGGLGDALELIDPHGGIADLAAQRLRTPLSPDESFTDDPLRMLRAARFLSGYGLEPDDDLVDAVKRLHGRLEIVSAERIRDELDKLLVVESPSAGLWFLTTTGLADEFLPELPALGLEQDPIHRHKDVLAHTIAVVEKTSPERILRLAALFHDVGKPKTRSIGPHGVSFHHHEVVGARITRDRMRALRYSAEDIEAVTKLVELHLRFHTYKMGWTDSAVRRYVRDAGPLLDELNELTRCDCTTRNKRRADELARRMDDLEARIAQLREQEELDAIRPDLDGRAVMDLLGVPAGTGHRPAPSRSCSRCGWRKGRSGARRPSAACGRGGTRSGPGRPRPSRRGRRGCGRRRRRAPGARSSRRSPWPGRGRGGRGR